MHAHVVAAFALAAAVAPSTSAPAPSAAGVSALAAGYLERWFQLYPGAATQAGRHDRDRELEDLSPARLLAWVQFNREALTSLDGATAAPGLTSDDALDVEALRGHIQRELLALPVLQRPQHDPLWWMAIVERATVHLMVRDDLPLADRLDRLDARALLVPRLARQAQAALESGDPKRIAPELCKIAAGQLRGSAQLFASGLTEASRGVEAKADGPDPIGVRLGRDGADAAQALLRLASFLDALGARATGSPRLGVNYAASFRWGTGLDEPLAAVLARARKDFIAKRSEAATVGRALWSDLLPGEEPPAGDLGLLRRLFARVSADADSNLADYLERWNSNIRALESFVRKHHVITLPDPLTLFVSTSPPYLLGQSVGGVYPAGPYSPEARTLFFLPVPPEGATSEQAASFFRDFNRGFNTMIAAHELMPGHYTQLKYAARHPHKVRALFADDVFVEGWGTFSERLMLDQGWGGPLARLAHLKKQLENIARAIVDIRVHTQGMTRDEVVRFVKDEALQGDQLAVNMWNRSLYSPVQLTTYYLGYREVNAVYDDARARLGAKFDLQAFMDGMMRLGPVAARHYRMAR
jgi:hypothetical protein